MSKLQFSGHESFICKHFWLKKGFDYIDNNKNFNDEDAIIELGVGKNMVTSISYWMKAFGLLDSSNQLSELSKYLFGKKGVDPYIENIGTLWLLHYSLIKTNKASLYNLFFNDFRKGKTEFTKDQLINFTKRLLQAQNPKSFNVNTVTSDINVFIRNYLKPSYRETKLDVEEDFSSLLIDLELIKLYRGENAEGKVVEWYRIENKLQIDLPASILLYSILDNDYGKSVSFKELLTGYNSPGVVFALNEEGLLTKIQQLLSMYKGLTFTENAGTRELQIKSSLKKEDVLNGYYKN